MGRKKEEPGNLILSNSNFVKVDIICERPISKWSEYKETVHSGNITLPYSINNNKWCFFGFSSSLSIIW